MNIVILVGRLGRDPETRFTGSGTAVSNFSLATDESYKDKSGQWKSKTEWHKVVVWGKQAESCQKNLKKGSLVAVEGKLAAREWQDKSGAKKQATEVVAGNVRFLDKKESNDSQNNQPFSQDTDDETIPF